MVNEEMRKELIKWYDRGANDTIESIRDSIKDVIGMIGDQKMPLSEIMTILDGFTTAKEVDKAIEADK